MADAGYESRKLARELKRRHGWRLHITKRRQRAFKVVGLTWIVERTFAWLSQKSSLEQRLRVEGPNFGSLHRPGGHPPHAQTARPEVKPLKHPLCIPYRPHHSKPVFLSWASQSPMLLGISRGFCAEDFHSMAAV